MRNLPITVTRWTVGLGGALLGTALGAFTPSVGVTLPPNSSDPLVVSHPGQWFGNAVALSGNLLAVGAPDELGAAAPAGAVYLFGRDESGWSLRLKILPPPDINYSRFGCAVAMSGELLVIGAENDATQANRGGAVYVFVLSADGPSLSAVPLGKLQPEDFEDSKYFGCDIAVEDGRIVVGALGDGTQYWRATGAAYVYDWDSTAGIWVKKTKLISYSSYGGSQFGAAVDLHGATVAVGAPYQPGSNGTTEAGAVFVFTLLEGEASTEQMLPPGEPQESGYVGWSVALDGAQLLVGAPGQQGADVVTGAALVYQSDAAGTWTYASTLQAADGKPGAEFGYDVAFQNGVAAVGAPMENYSSGSTAEDQVTYAGAVYLFEATANGFTGGTKLTLPSRVPGQRFGFSVAFQDNLLAVGAPGCNLSFCPADSDLDGAAYAFAASLNQAPTAAAAASETSVTVAAGAEATVTLDGTASSDPDGDPLTFTWLDATGQTIATTSTAAVSLGVGVHSFTLQVSDGTLSAQATLEITVQVANQPPVADASRTVTRAISSNNRDALVRLDGSRSSDPDGDTLSYGWFAEGALAAEGAVAEVRLPLGENTLRLIVTDGYASAETTVLVRAITAATAVRELSASVARAKLPHGKKVACQAILRSATRTFERGKTRLAVHELQVLQQILRTRSVDPRMAKPLIAEAQRIIDAVQGH